MIEPKDVRGLGVVAAVGDLIVSSDQLLRSGGELADMKLVDCVLPEVVELAERMRNGTCRFERKDVKLSLRLLMELVKLSLRGL